MISGGLKAPEIRDAGGENPTVADDLISAHTTTEVKSNHMAQSGKKMVEQKPPEQTTIAPPGSRYSHSRPHQSNNQQGGKRQKARLGRAAFRFVKQLEEGYVRQPRAPPPWQSSQIHEKPGQGT
jgi:hypothetical protein